MVRSLGTPLLAVALITSCAAPAEDEAPQFDRASATAAVSGVLDALHHNASVANEEAYFSLFAPEGIFHGTDITERWTVDQFREYAHASFSAGSGWTYVLRPGTRNIEFSPEGTTAWFDEILDNENYGATRGTGVLRLIDGEWKFTQYHLVIPVPNDLARIFVDMIREADATATD